MQVIVFYGLSGLTKLKICQDNTRCRHDTQANQGFLTNRLWNNVEGVLEEELRSF